MLLGKGPVHEARGKALWHFRPYISHKVAAEIIWVLDQKDIFIYTVMIKMLKNLVKNLETGMDRWEISVKHLKV